MEHENWNIFVRKNSFLRWILCKYVKVLENSRVPLFVSVCEYKFLDLVFKWVKKTQRKYFPILQSF